ncbi:hypothetical protein BJF83_24300 [Nocardiopsis sp. CNR-923]|uniref:tetratricopeptide repeat protein n=1 Tax=Nocardiopsis sp. CNR-923 TaxID=1904965 RepID=UPI00095A48C9|nr:tetratricopeptide repeat protein [Nocardiopsis sp. CNR-923]OLT24339.1 hypothetical protein BJF83_24300 [Nocardiopsis sp. CNR-923]
MSGPSYDGDHVDFSGGSFHGRVVGTEVYHHAGPTPTALWGLPAPATGFSGRERELTDLLDLIDPRHNDNGHDQDGGGVVVSAVSGMGGIGKTALAVVAGDRALSRGWFCGAVFVNLRGYDPDPATPAQGLEAVLRALGVHGEDLPAGAEERAALYRSQLATTADERGGPVLVVADNASSVDQARALLPGGGGHQLLVTSRDPLDALHAPRLGLKTLSVEASVGLMASVMAVTDNGDDRLEAEPEAARTIATACGGLPLALLVCVSLLRTDPDQPLTELATQLADPKRRLGVLDDGYRSVTALFDLAVHALPAEQEQLFALMGIAPGREITTSDAAILTDATVQRARRLLADLARAQLITRTRGTGRWSMHDLTRAYARHHADVRTAHNPDSAQTQKAALVRLLDHYTTTANQADDHLRALPGDTVPDTFSGRDEAMIWLDQHYDTLVEAVHTAKAIGHTPTATRLPLNLSVYLDWRRAFDDKITLTTLARDTYHQLGHAHGEAAAWNNLGLALREVRRFEEAIDAHTRARTLQHQVGDAHGEAQAWHGLGLVLQRLGRQEEARRAFEQAVRGYRDTGDDHWLGIVEGLLADLG